MEIVENDVVRLNYVDRDYETVDFDFFCELDHGMRLFNTIGGLQISTSS
jgi:hypothetical protein